MYETLFTGPSVSPQITVKELYAQVNDYLDLNGELKVY